MRKMADVRKEKGYTVRSLAEAVGMSPTTINGIENGRIGRPQYGTVVKIARELGVDPREVEEFRPVVEEAEGTRQPSWPRIDDLLGNPGMLRESRPNYSQPEPLPQDRLQRDLDFAEREDLTGLVEAEAGNATGVDPMEEDVMENPELVRIGLRGALRALMQHLGRAETLRAYRRVFGATPKGEESARTRRQAGRETTGEKEGGDEEA